MRKLNETSDDEVINFRKMLESLKAADLDEGKMNQLSLEIEEWVGDAYDRYGHQVGGDERALMAYRKKFPDFENEFHKKWNEAEMDEEKDEDLDESHTAQWRRDIDALYNILGESDINQDHRVSHGPIWENPKKQTWNNPDAKIWDDLSQWFSFKLDQSNVEEHGLRYYTAGGVLHIEDDGYQLPYAPINKKALGGSLSNLGMSMKELVAWLEGQGVKQKKKPDWMMDKKYVIGQMIKKLQDSNMLYTAFILNYLRAEGIDWPELDIIEKSVKKELSPGQWKMTLLGHLIGKEDDEAELVIYIDHKIKTDMLALSSDIDSDLSQVKMYINRAPP